MNIDPIYREPQKRFANVPKVIGRLIKRDMGWLNRELTSQKLLFGLYVYYRNALKKNRDLEENIVSLKNRIEVLNQRIDDLEEYEKEVIHKGFRASITYFSWSCGDGCCSDGWHGYKVFNPMDECVKVEGMSGSNSYLTKQECEKRIEEKYGDIPIDDSGYREV